MTDYTSKRLHRRLAEDNILLGLANHYPSPAVIESMGHGWDFIWIDCQHGQTSYDSALASVRTAQGMELDTLLRVESRDPDLMGKYADMGVSAIMVPQVEDAEQAEAIVRALRYPPRGHRSFASRRLVDLVGVDHHLQPQPLIVAQIESRRALDRVAQIIEIDGIDALFFGPDDVRLDMGLAHDTSPLDHQELNEAMSKTAQAARAVGKHAGVPAPTPELLTAVVDMGYQLLACGGDAGFVRVGARAQLTALRSVLGKLGHPASSRDAGT